MNLKRIKEIGTATSIITIVIIASGCIGKNSDDHTDDTYDTSYDYYYSINLEILNQSSIKSDYYIIVPIPVYHNWNNNTCYFYPCTELINNLSSNSSVSKRLEKTLHGVGLNISYKGNLLLETYGTMNKTPYSNFNMQNESISRPADALGNHYYWIYSSYIGMIHIEIEASYNSNDWRIISEHTSRISGNISYGWNLVSGYESYITD